MSTQIPLPSFPTPHPIQPDFLASQPLITTMSINDPVMTASPAVTTAGAVVILGQAATASNDPTNPTLTGARQRVPSGNSAQTTDLVPVSSPVTQGQSGMSKPKQLSRDFMSHGKNFLGVTKRQISKRSKSEPYFE